MCQITAYYGKRPFTLLGNEMGWKENVKYPATTAGICILQLEAQVKQSKSNPSDEGEIFQILNYSHNRPIVVAMTNTVSKKRITNKLRLLSACMCVIPTNSYLSNILKGCLKLSHHTQMLHSRLFDQYFIERHSNYISWTHVLGWCNIIQLLVEQLRNRRQCSTAQSFWK